MIVQPHSSRWQTVIADLSLILFLVCAAALQDGPSAPASAAPASAASPPAPQETPVMLGVWRDVPGGISLADWLAEQPADDSQRLSIEVTYRAGQVEAAFARADAIRRSAGAAGANARVLITEGAGDAVLAQLVQDLPQAATGPDIAQLD